MYTALSVLKVHNRFMIQYYYLYIHFIENKMIFSDIKTIICNCA